MISPEVVIFAIQAGLQLYGAGRRAYVDGTRGRALTLPLPRAPGIEFDSAHSWFTLEAEGILVVERTPRLQRLLLGASSADRAELVDVYLAFRAELDPAWPDGTAVRGQFTSDQLSALLEIRQWADAESGQPVTALQQVAGTLINLAVDYFAHTPGAVSPQRPGGRALLAFLTASDAVNFANTPVVDVAGELMVAVLDAVPPPPASASVRLHTTSKRPRSPHTVPRSMSSCLDLRSGRTQGRVLSSQQWEDLKAWIGARQFNLEPRHLLVVSSIPLVHMLGETDATDPPLRRLARVSGSISGGVRKRASLGTAAPGLGAKRL